MFPRFAVLALTLSLAAFVPAGAMAAPTVTGPGAFVNELGNEVIHMLGNADLPAAEREREFRRLFVKGFDIDRISQFVLGRHWRTATEAQRAEYQRLFSDYIVSAYLLRLSHYSGESFIIKDARTDTSGESVVHSMVERENRPPVRVDWRVRGPDSEYKIIDVVVEGVSMAITHRSEFAAVIQNGGGSIDALLDALRRRPGAPR
jgi:phospholipid transport system substrate-binding protein